MICEWNQGFWKRTGAAGLGLTICLAALLTGPGALAQGETMQWETRTKDLPDWVTTKTELAKLSVPETRGSAKSNTLMLMVARVKAKKPAGNPPVVYLAGGPGGSAIGASRNWTLVPTFKRLNENHDIVFMDQRGTGRSEPSLYYRAKDPLPETFFANIEDAAAHFRKLHLEAIAHFKGEGVDLTAYNSLASAHDLEALRLALGEKQVILFGFSYGTHLALTMLKYHPASVARAILVGSEGLDQTMKLPSTYEAQLDKLAFLAANDPDIGKTVPDLRALVTRVLAKLEKKPVKIPIHNRDGEQVAEMLVGKVGLQLILRMDIGDGNDFPDFPRMLHALDRGDSSLLAPYVTKRYFQFSRGISVMSTVMDLASGASTQRMKRIELESKNSFLGPWVNFGSEKMLELYPGIDLGESFREPFTSHVPTLFVSGTMDSNTPPYQAEMLRWRFNQSEHLILKYGGHEDMLPHPEIQKAMVAFANGQPVASRTIDQPRPAMRPID